MKAARVTTAHRRRMGAGVTGLVVSTALLVGGSVEAAPPAAPFPPGTWRGVAVLYGTMSSEDVDVHSTQPMKLTFEVEVEVGVDGVVVSGSWALSGGGVEVEVPNGSGSFTLDGAGELDGTAERVGLLGEIGLEGSVNVQGQTFPASVVSEAAGGFSPATATCTYVTGDIATEIRAAQQAAGFSTSVVGPFTAHRIEAPDEQLPPQVEGDFIQLVSDAHIMFEAPETPTMAALLDLLGRAEAFSLSTYDSSGCLDGPSGVGAAPYSQLVETLGVMVRDALTQIDPADYSASDLNALALAARTLGIFGPSAPDAELAGPVDQAVHGAFSDKIDDAAAQPDPSECQILAAAVAALGYSDLGLNASSCAAGA